MIHVTVLKLANDAQFKKNGFVMVGRRVNLNISTSELYHNSKSPNTTVMKPHNGYEELEYNSIEDGNPCAAFGLLGNDLLPPAHNTILHHLRRKAQKSLGFGSEGYKYKTVMTEMDLAFDYFMYPQNGAIRQSPPFLVGRSKWDK